MSDPLAVGITRDGRVFVVDRAGTFDARFYVGADGHLQRNERGGLGDWDRFPEHHVWIYELGESDEAVVLKIDAQAVGRGQLGPQHFAMELILRDESGLTARHTHLHHLKVLSPDQVRGWRVDNWPQTIDVEYLSHTDDGRWILVTRHGQLHSPNQGEIRLFFGPADAIRERRHVRLGRQGDGGTTGIFFDLDDVPARAFFPVHCEERKTGVPWYVPPCPGTLTMGDEKLVLHPAMDANELNGLQFVCNEQQRQTPTGAKH